MSLRFPYLAPSTGKPGQFLRPFLPVSILGVRGRRYFPRALLDTGSEDTIFPAAVAQIIGVDLEPRRGRKSILRWRGVTYPLLFGSVNLELSDGSESLSWPTEVGFSAAPIPYVLLGNNSCLEFFDATFLAGLERLSSMRIYPFREILDEVATNDCQAIRCSSRQYGSTRRLAQRGCSCRRSRASQSSTL